ncbi:hypothetical protein AAH119_06110, partial [Bacteroides thetaiotaomicron]|uniref:hypothetical protein n=2 Tax=Bacteroides TaxID=816 RepID=UPI0039B66350
IQNHYSFVRFAIAILFYTGTLSGDYSSSELPCQLQEHGRYVAVIVGDGNMTNTNVKGYYTNLYIPISTCRNPDYKQVDTLVFSADSSDLVKADVISVDQ